MSELERSRARITAGELAYVDEGRGPVVLLLHGFPASADLWRNLVPLLAPRFRVVAPDLLGYGWSDKPPGADLSVHGQAGHVRALLKELGVREFAVVGHGLGGGVAQLLAAGGGVRTLVLIDSVAFESGRLTGTDTEHASAEDVVRDSFTRGMGHPERLPPDDLERFIRPWRDDPSALARALEATDAPGLSGVAGRIRELDIPILLVWGEEDPWVSPSVAERLQEELGDAALAILPGCSHFVVEDAPETVTPIVFEFLRLRFLGERHAHTPTAVPVDLGVSFERPRESLGLVDEED